MSLKAKLHVKLFAGDVLVAEAEDPQLWNKVLGIIQGGQELGDQNNANISEVEDVENNSSNYVDKLAKELGVSSTELQGACDPIESPPYIRLDHKYWEEFKNNTPGRGPKAVSPIQLAGTLLYFLYKKIGKESNPTQAEAKAVLKTIGLRDSNASRALKNCEWLQNRNGTIQINPARYTQAIAVAKAYVTQTSIQEKK